MSGQEWDAVPGEDALSELEEVLPPAEECPKKPKRRSGFCVVAVQAAVCALLLLAAVAVRMLGGDLSEWWRGELREALGDNRIVDWAFGAWTDGGDDSSGAPSEDVSETAVSEPTGSAAANLPFVSDGAAGAVSRLSATEPAEQTAAIRRSLPLPTCLPLFSGELTSGYGEREHPISGEDSFHTGWDIAAEAGTPIAAMYDATVTETGSGGSYGNYVQLRVDNRLSFLYAHCSQVLVREGDNVAAGQTVARVGSTGVSTGNHLHLEILIDGRTCDPAIVLAREVYLS